MKGRAQTDTEKREIIERLYSAWIRDSHLRLGQLIMCATNSHPDIFYIEDEDLVTYVEEYIGREVYHLDQIQ